MSTITTGKVIIYKPNFNVNPLDTLLDLPVLGAENTLYVIKDTGAIYIWNGSEFITYDSIPTGGATGEVLAKASATDRDVEWIDPTGGVKEYIALLNQTGTDAPVATVLKNTLGGEVTFGYDSAGSYTINSNSLFIDNKTFIQITLGYIWNANIGLVNYFISSENLINLITFDSTVSGNGNNDVLQNCSIKIEVYP